MSPTAAQLRTMVNQFMAFTGANERAATKFIKASNYKVNEAVDEYFHTQGGSNGPSALDAELDSLFDSLRSENDSKDQMELDSTMSYLSNDLKVNIENAELFVVLELLQAPSVGEISRKGFLDAWKAANVQASNEEHAKYVRGLVKSLSTDPVLFKKVYKYAFVVGREKDQKALSLEIANVYWDMLFAPPGMEWKNAHRDWLALWKQFLAEKWTRSVNRDMWNMALEFAFKSIDDDSLSFWNEDGAWPSVIDDFVEWCKVRGVVKSEQMEVDGA